jgi:hypothetical protein
LEQSVPGKNAPPAVERSTAQLEGGVEFAASHRLDGVLMMSGGPVLKEHAFDGARIIDVAPTVLYLMGLPIPDDMDGRVLVESLDEEFVEANPIEFEAIEADTEETADDAKQGFTQDESELIAKRLQALGYIK